MASPGPSPLPPARPAATGDDWLGLWDEPLPVEAATRWAARPDCGAVVAFSGLVRDHADGRPGVDQLTYEAYEAYAQDRMADVAEVARRRWPSVGKVAILHRVGALLVGDAAVVVVVSAPHRDAAFDAARFCIDTVKASVPIWKHERWAAGEAWGTDAQPLSAAADAVASGTAAG